MEQRAGKRAALNPLDMVLSVTHGFIEYCGIHCYVHQWSDVSIGGLLKAHSTEGSYCDSTQLRALIGSGPFFPDVLPTLGLKWLTLPTQTHKHTVTAHGDTDRKDNGAIRDTEGTLKTKTAESKTTARTRRVHHQRDSQDCVHTDDNERAAHLRKVRGRQ